MPRAWQVRAIHRLHVSGLQTFPRAHSDPHSHSDPRDQAGDVLLVDNFMYSHGRAPYMDGVAGARKHVALFSEKVDRGVQLPVR